MALYMLNANGKIRWVALWKLPIELCDAKWTQIEMYFLFHSPLVDSGAGQESAPLQKEFHTVIILQYV